MAKRAKKRAPRRKSTPARKANGQFKKGGK